MVQNLYNISKMREITVNDYKDNNRGKAVYKIDKMANREFLLALSQLHDLVDYMKTDSELYVKYDTEYIESMIIDPLDKVLQYREIKGEKKTKKITETEDKTSST